MSVNAVNRSIAALGCLLLSGCWVSEKGYTPIEKKQFGYVYRQHAAEPVYNRLRWVHLPEPLPSAETPGSGAAPIIPVVHLELKNVTIEEAAATLASTGRYRSFVESSLVGRKVSFDSLGTMDELASQLAARENLQIEVDHKRRLVRFMAKDVRPTFFRDEVALDEHQSSN